MKLRKPRTKDKAPARPWRRMMALTVSLMTLTTALHLTSTGAVQAEETLPLPIRDGRMVLYVQDEADLLLPDSLAQHIDQINFAFALIENGEATGSHWRSAAKVKSYLARHSQLTGVMAVGGWGADGFSQACASQEGRTRLAESILSLMDEHGFTGVEIDWEYPGISAGGTQSGEHDVENWHLLLEELRAGLDRREETTGREYILSVALGAGEKMLKDLDGTRLDAAVDQAVIMAYDLKGFDRVTGHHAGLYPDGKTKDTGAWAVARAVESGIPAEKLLLGVPAYGRVWRQVSGSGNGLGVHAATSGNRTMPYGELLELEKQGYTRYYDEKAQAAWWYNGTDFISGEDARSLKYKADWLRDNGLAGAAVWAWHHDDAGMLTATLDAALTDHFGGEEPATGTDLGQESD